MVKKQSKKATRSQRAWIGLGVIAVVAVALIVGLGALSIQPTVGQSGTATVSFFTRDGTQVNATADLIDVYVCDYSSADNIEQFVADFDNYEQLELNSSYFKNLDFEIEIKTNQTVMLKIKDASYFEEWYQILPGSRNIILNEIPDGCGMSQVLLTQNATHTTGRAIIALYEFSGSNITQNKNHSIPAFIDDFASNVRKFLMLKCDKSAANYTTKAMNVSLAETFIYNGDLYIKLNADLSLITEFELIVDLVEMGQPTISLVYADPNFESITTLFSINNNP